MRPSTPSESAKGGGSDDGALPVIISGLRGRRAELNTGTERSPPIARALSHPNHPSIIARVLVDDPRQLIEPLPERRDADRRRHHEKRVQVTILAPADDVLHLTRDADRPREEREVAR
jgi:hypothetical protein